MDREYSPASTSPSRYPHHHHPEEAGAPAERPNISRSHLVEMPNRPLWRMKEACASSPVALRSNNNFGSRMDVPDSSKVWIFNPAPIMRCYAYWHTTSMRRRAAQLYCRIFFMFVFAAATLGGFSRFMIPFLSETLRVSILRIRSPQFGPLSLYDIPAGGSLVTRSRSSAYAEARLRASTRSEVER